MSVPAAAMAKIGDAVFKLTLSFKGRILKVCQTTETEIAIGREPGCGLRIDNLAVRPVHARVRLTEQGPVLTRVGEASDMLINGVPMRGEEQPLVHGDSILIGKHTITVARDHGFARAPADDAAQARPLAQGWLQFLSGPKLGRTVRLDHTMVRLGKAGQQSAMIANRSDGFYISHLEGTEPTRVGERVVGEHSLRLCDGDIIQIGEVRLLFFTEPL